MKKFYGFILFAIAMVMAMPANAQFKFGVKAGLNVTNPSLSKEVINADNRNGFFVGPMVEFTVPIVGLGVDAALLYDNKSLKLENEESGQSVSETLHYIDIPINVKYTIGLGSLASVYAATGPQFSYNIGGKNILKQSYALNKSDFSWNIGAGIKVLRHIQVGYNYNIALGNTGEVKEDGAFNTVLGVAKDALKKDFKSNTHQISIAYIF
ncbi:MAG: porin family protein [Bacteroidaceae bacterium]|nr:porin family protein [Bacteroidaceae bacterium]